MFFATHHPSFRRIATVYTSAIVVEWFGSVALMALVYQQTQSTTAVAALLLCKQVIPGALLPALGQQLDRLPVERSLVLTLVAQAGAFVGIGVVGYGPLVFALALVAGAAGGLVRALLRASIGRSFEGRELASANATLNLAIGIAGILGPALAAGAVVGAGAASSLVLASAVLATLAIWVLASPRALASARRGPVAESVPCRDAHGVSPGPVGAIPLAGLLVMVGVLMCLFSMDDATLMAYSEVSLAAGVGGYGAIVLAWGVGIAVGSLLFTRLLHWPMLRIYSLATILAGLAYLGLSVSPSIAIACALAVVGGMGNGMDWVAVVTLVQQATPRGHETRAATRLEAIATAGPGIGILAGGLLADLASPRASLFVPGVLALATLFVGATLLRRGAFKPSSGALAERRADPTLVPSIPGGSA